MNERKPYWLKTKLPKGKEYLRIKEIVHKNRLHTICESGKCPNLSDCWSRGTATFMILGEICTRSCKFCATKTGKPLAVDKNEAQRIAQSVKMMNLKHCVITSVDRDDLKDRGSEAWVNTIKEIKKTTPEVTIEVLIPDFDGEKELIMKVINAKPDVISHNLETVKRLTPQIRSKAKYETSLEVIRQISMSGITSKSGIMLGLGENENEVLETMDDLISLACKVFTIGQYLQPTKQHLPVKEYVHLDKFREYEDLGLKKGFAAIESTPLVRSSYRAEKHVNL